MQLTAAVFLGDCVGNAQVSAVATQVLNVQVGANAKLQAVQPTVNLAPTGPVFASFAGSVTLQYKVRTTVGTGSSSVTARAGGEFTPSFGPRIGSGDLTYTCGGATLGTACSGIQTVSIVTQTSVLTVGSGTCTGQGCSGSDPNSVTIGFDLANSPAYKTGTYSTGLTFTISSI